VALRYWQAVTPNGATKAALRWMEKEELEDRRVAPWERFSRKSGAGFADGAIPWLKDASELRSKTIDGVDWVYVCDYFRSMSGEPPLPEAAPGKPVHHRRTGELVGWLTKDEFIPVDQGEGS
jgi:hypothetical protein